MCGRGTSETARMNVTPVEPLDQRRELRRRQPHDAVLNRRPTEPAILQALVDHNQAATVPDQQLHAVRPLGAEDVDRASVGIEPEVFLNQSGEPIDPFASDQRSLCGGSGVIRHLRPHPTSWAHPRLSNTSNTDLRIAHDLQTGKGVLTGRMWTPPECKRKIWTMGM